jgi:inosose dehydratase
MTRRDFIHSAALAPIFLDALKKQNFQIGYSAITWNGNDLVAIKDIAALGFKGIQLRATAYQAFKDKPEDLKLTLDATNLKLIMFSSGNITLNGDIKADIETHVNHAKFVKALGGHSLQFTNNSRPKDRPPTTDELKKFAQNMSEVAKAVKLETGIQPAYHNHMHQLGETPEEVEIIFREMNPDYVLALLDVAHYKQGGGEPHEAVLKYADILYATHIKDTKQLNTERQYQFVELGQGRVDFKKVFEALNKIKFKGWNIVELDAVPVKGRSALECGQISMKYLKEDLKLKFG